MLARPLVRLGNFDPYFDVAYGLRVVRKLANNPELDRHRCTNRARKM